MNEIELFEFDRQGYIVIEGLLQADVVAALSRAVDDLEEHAVLRVQDPPRQPSGWGGAFAQQKAWPRMPGDSDNAVVGNVSAAAPFASSCEVSKTRLHRRGPSSQPQNTLPGTSMARGL